VDYSPGTDISRYKNIPVPTSYMAINSDYDFVGGYENDSKGGVIHVANHHVSPGKKQWTWGHGYFGIAWDRNLTDEDGPYIELMCGVYTDNQPDFTWLMPNEEKMFTQYFIPYRDLGVVKCATKEALINLETENDFVEIKAFTTSVYKNAKVILLYKNEVLMTETFDFNPASSFQKKIHLPGGTSETDLIAVVKTVDGITLVEFRTGKNLESEIPEPAKAAKRPEETESNEQLYLTGLHLEQYRHATYDPRPYYDEAIKRDPKDYRCNNALGLWYLRRGQFAKAEGYLRTAVKTITERNPNPVDGEPLYNLGVTLAFQGKHDEAYKYFYKSVWNAAWMDNGYFQVARIDAMNGRWDEALDAIERSILRNWHNHKARQLKTSILRHSCKIAEALVLCDDSLTLDRFNFGLYFEKYKLTGDRKYLDELQLLIRGNIHSYVEFALDYAWAGLYQDAVEFISYGIEIQNAESVFPMALYYKAWFEMKVAKYLQSAKTLKSAALATPDYCFPNQPESVVVLDWAVCENPSDYKALYYLGNFWYAFKNYFAAISCWEKSVALNGNFPTSHRNLALACFNKLHDHERALELLEKAFSLDTTDARILMELDQLYKRLNKKPEFRLSNLQKYPGLVNDRDDLYLELVSLHNISGEYEKAYELIMSRIFHPWEGGEGKVPSQYIFSLVEMAKNAIQQKNFKLAIELLQKARKYPENLGEGKLYGAKENELYYWLGEAYRGFGDTANATAAWKEAKVGLNEVSAAMFYNDQQPDITFYQGLALRKLGNEKAAVGCFRKLVNFGEAHLKDHIEIDYFAVSLPDLLIWEDDLDKRNHLLCKYLIGLGELGLGNRTKSRKLLQEALDEDLVNISVLKHLELIRIL